MGHPVDKVAVVRKENQALGVGVQSSGRHQARPRNPNEIGDFLFRMSIRNRGNVADGLIERDVVAPCSRRIDCSAIHRDPLRIGVGHGSGGSDDFTVDAYPTGRDNLLGVTTRGDSGGGDYFLQALLRLLLIGGWLFHIEMLPE